MELKIFVVVALFACVKSQFFEDRRCRCVCPSPASVLNVSSTRQVYTGNVPPNKCNCIGVVVPFIEKLIEGKEYIYCPRCDCKYESRNTTLIMNDSCEQARKEQLKKIIRTLLRPYEGVVFMLLLGICVSILYMTFLKFLQWFAGRNTTTALDFPNRSHTIAYQFHNDLDDESIVLAVLFVVLFAISVVCVTIIIMGAGVRLLQFYLNRAGQAELLIPILAPTQRRNNPDRPQREQPRNPPANRPRANSVAPEHEPNRPRRRHRRRPAGAPVADANQNVVIRAAYFPVVLRNRRRGVARGGRRAAAVVAMAMVLRERPLPRRGGNSPMHLRALRRVDYREVDN